MHTRARTTKGIPTAFATYRLPTRCALFPLNFSQRIRIASQYGGSISKRKARLGCSAAIKGEPLPPKRSTTLSPERVEYWSARIANSTGFSVKWTMHWGLTFLTDQTSVALLGPKNWWAAPSFQP